MRRDATAYGAIRPAWDRNDCSIRALAVATGVSYEIASAVYSAQGRRLGKGTPVDLTRRILEEHLGMKRVDMVKGWRLDEFLDVAQRGSFIVHKTRHAFAIVEGTVHDWEGASRGSTRLEDVWKVSEGARAKMKKLEELVKELGE